MDQHSTPTILITEVTTKEAVWGRTTCGLCEEGCPIENRAFCRGAGGGSMWKEEEHGTGGRINQKRFESSQHGRAGDGRGRLSLYMTMVEDTLKSQSLEEKMRVRDLAELIAGATGANSK